MSEERTSPPPWPSQAVAVQQVAAAPLPLALTSPDGVLLATSASFRAQISDSELNEELAKQRIDLRREALRRCCAGETVRDSEIQMSGPDGVIRWVQVERGPCYDAAGQVVAILGHVTDVTEQVLARRALVEVQDQLTAALGIDRMSVVVVNVKTGETTTTCLCEELVDVLQDVGPDLLHVFSEDRLALQSTIGAWIARKTPEILRCEYRLARDPNIWVSTTSRGYLDENGELDRIINVFQDITDRRKAQENIERVAFTDALTGLPNRAKFQLEFDKAVEAAQKTGRPMGLIMVDVDHFKDINDTLGHDAGDALLTALGGQLRRAFRRGDMVARLGGDEFAILLPDAASDNDLLRPLAAIQSALTKPIDYKGQGIRICTSIGAALHADPDADPSHVLKNADIALYKAKEQGRDQVVVFEPQMRSEVEQRLELLRDVRKAIPRGEFILFYQPIVNLGLSKVSGFEALMRWNHPDQGILPPAVFMAALEDQDLSLQLGEITIETALKQIRAWMDEGLDFGRVSINLSASQFRTGRLARDLRARMQYWGVPPDRLTVEVTENVYLGWGAEMVAETVRELHEHGVTIALDDFGTGYASLANLRQFPIDRLKIDKSFVQNVDDDAIVRAVINLGASMGMEVVAEGVERPEQLGALLRYGCDQVQGFHFAKPMPPAEVSGYLSHFSGAKSGRSAA